MDPRLSLLAVLSTALANGIPAIGGRVGVLRIDPVWGDEELPIILLDFDSERREVETVSPRVYRHTLDLDVLIYCKGQSDKARVQLLGLMRQVDELFAEWQFILCRDVEPDYPNSTDMVVHSFGAGDSINYFKSPNGDKDHVAVRMGYVAEFSTSGSSQGEERRGAPNRNVLSDFSRLLIGWTPLGMDAGATDDIQIP